MMVALQVPSADDWGSYKDDIDQEYAYRVFGGRNLEEVRPFFERNVIERASELLFMPSIPFRYYMLAFRNYVMSDGVLSNNMAPDAASSFLNLVLSKLRDDPDAIRPILKELMPAIEYVTANQSLFDADLDIYGDFRKKLAEIQGLT